MKISDTIIINTDQLRRLGHGIEVFIEDRLGACLSEALKARHWKVANGALQHGGFDI